MLERWSNGVFRSTLHRVIVDGQERYSVRLLSRIHHRNLVRFLGYSQQDKKNILVYEFMHNGTLKEHLRGAAARERTVSWIKRLEIAEDAARGIEDLHTGCSPTIIHRDLKSSNILLDMHIRAKDVSEVREVPDYQEAFADSLFLSCWISKARLKTLQVLFGFYMTLLVNRMQKKA